MKEGEKMEKEFKGLWVSREVLENENLSPFDKLILAEIERISDNNGCVAPNVHFSEIFGMLNSRSSQAIKNLEKKGVIKIEYFTAPNGRQRRRIILTKGV